MKKIQKNKLINIVLITLLFVFAFVILIDRQKNNNLGDMGFTKFDLKTIVGKQLVVRDMDAIYPKYYVIYFNQKDNSYIIHNFNYYETRSQYDLEFNRLLKSVVDYNVDDYMIRILHSKGLGSFNEIKNNLSYIIGSNNLRNVE